MHLKKDESSPQTAPPPTAENKPSDPQIGQPIALPPQFGNEPPEPGQSQTQYMPNGMPALQPKGVNVETLFAENIKDTGKRFNRVENAVVDLREEFEVYKPAIVRLTAVEADIQNLIKELEVLLQETPTQQQPLHLTDGSDARLQVEQLDPQPPPPDIPTIVNDTESTMQSVIDRQTSGDNRPETERQVIKEPEEEKPPERATPPPKPQPPAVAKTYDGVVAQNLRVGEHADKLRLVLDTNQRTDFTIDLDNDEKLIIIEMPNARWVGSERQTYPNSKLIDSYTIESLNNGKGTMMVIALKKGTKILQEKRLSPDNTSPYHRIYFDLKL